MSGNVQLQLHQSSNLCKYLTEDPKVETKKYESKAKLHALKVIVGIIAIPVILAVAAAMVYCAVLTNPFGWQAALLTVGGALLSVAGTIRLGRLVVDEAYSMRDNANQANLTRKYAAALNELRGLPEEQILGKLTYHEVSMERYTPEEKRLLGPGTKGILPLLARCDVSIKLCLDAAKGYESQRAAAESTNLTPSERSSIQKKQEALRIDSLKYGLHHKLYQAYLQHPCSSTHNTEYLLHYGDGVGNMARSYVDTHLE